jgi:cytochrome b involved in lipid metabolism
MSQTVSKEQVAAHNKSDSLWIVIDEDVYDVTKFQDDHPGGKKSMLASISSQYYSPY